VIVPVLTLDIEDYLYGVVPYEMSDSFPVEALKAQAWRPAPTR
jgi:stage II sporulation protein D